jgi:hypothetical protein
MANVRFQEYATSGAFSLGLTRNQVSTLDMIDRGAHQHVATFVGSLERKGLVEAVPAPTVHNPDAVEHRLTQAGLLTVALVREAGLTNAAPDPISTEMTALRDEVARARKAEAVAKRDAYAAMARLERAELDLENEQALRRHEKQKVRILRRDPTPEVSNADLRERIGAPQ